MTLSLINLFCFSEIKFKVNSGYEHFLDNFINIKSQNFSCDPILNSKSYFEFINNNNIIKNDIKYEKAFFIRDHLTYRYRSIYYCVFPEDLVSTHNKFLSFFSDYMKRDAILNLHLSSWYKTSLSFKEKKLVLQYERTVLLHKWALKNNPKLMNEFMENETWGFVKSCHDSETVLTFLKIRSKEIHEKNLSLNVGNLHLFWIFVTSVIMGHILGFGIVYGLGMPLLEWWINL